MASQGDVTVDGRTVRVSLGEIVAFSNAVVRFDLVPTIVDNLDLVSSVQGDQPDSDSLNNRSRITLPVVPAPPADVSVSISAAPDAPRVGETASFSVVVSNNGPGDAEDVILTNELPVGAELVASPVDQPGNPGHQRWHASGQFRHAHAGSAGVALLRHPFSEPWAVDERRDRHHHPARPEPLERPGGADHRRAARRPGGPGRRHCRRARTGAGRPGASVLDHRLQRRSGRGHRLDDPGAAPLGSRVDRHSTEPGVGLDRAPTAS